MPLLACVGSGARGSVTSNDLVPGKEESQHIVGGLPPDGGGAGRSRSPAAERPHRFQGEPRAMRVPAPWRSPVDLNHRPRGPHRLPSGPGALPVQTPWRMAEVSIPRPFGPHRFRSGPRALRVRHPWWHAAQVSILAVPLLESRRGAGSLHVVEVGEGVEPSWRALRARALPLGHPTMWSLLEDSNPDLGFRRPAPCPVRPRRDGLPGRDRTSNHQLRRLAFFRLNYGQSCCERACGGERGTRTLEPFRAAPLAREFLGQPDPLRGSRGAAYGTRTRVTSSKGWRPGR